MGMSIIFIAKLEIMSGIIVADLDPNVAIHKDMIFPGNPIMVLIIRICLPFVYSGVMLASLDQVIGDLVPQDPGLGSMVHGE